MRMHSMGRPAGERSDGDDRGQSTLAKRGWFR